VKGFWFDTEPFLKAAYAFGEVVDGAVKCGRIRDCG